MGARTWTDEMMIDAIKESKNISGVVNRLKMTRSSGSHNTVKNFIIKNSIDISHFKGKSLGKLREVNRAGMVSITEGRYHQLILKEHMMDSILAERNEDGR